ncbi:hypothetical protein NLI96_g4632 [Meripilus lineatus]|uniref:Uncharacterized protein n=1 Tax=Meripilus lineatus TaxID=2056292 RepID=A0AAD5V6R8_9APHY|nr:hypothetical protein NLI96_g4632 [Physisporinus lineatus]
MLRWKRDCNLLRWKLENLQQDHSHLREQSETKHQDSTLAEERHLQIFLNLQKDNNALSIQSKWIGLQLRAKNQEATVVASERDHLLHVNDALEARLSMMRAERTRLGEGLKHLQSAYSVILQGSRELNGQRTRSMYTLVLTTLVLWRFSRHLGSRLLNEMKAKSAALTQWRSISHQKVEARRDSIRAIALGQDLQTRLEIEAKLRDSESTAVLKWHTEYYKSVKARARAATKFRSYRDFAAKRYSNTTIKLLSGLLVLWRLCFILTQNLAEARALIRALELSATEALEEANSEDKLLLGPISSEHISVDDFSQLPAVEAKAAYAHLSRDYQRLRLEYLRYIDNRASPGNDAPLPRASIPSDHMEGFATSPGPSKSEILGDATDQDKTPTSITTENTHSVGEVYSLEEPSSDSQGHPGDAQAAQRVVQEELRTTREMLTLSEDRCRSLQANLFKTQTELRAAKESHERIRERAATLEGKVSTLEKDLCCAEEDKQELLKQVGMSENRRRSLQGTPSANYRKLILLSRNDDDAHVVSPSVDSQLSLSRRSSRNFTLEMQVARERKDATEIARGKADAEIRELKEDYHNLNVTFAMICLQSKREIAQARKNVQTLTVSHARLETRRADLDIRVVRLIEKVKWLETMDEGYRQLLFLNPDLIPRRAADDDYDSDSGDASVDSDCEDEEPPRRQVRTRKPTFRGVQSERQPVAQASLASDSPVLQYSPSPEYTSSGSSVNSPNALDIAPPVPLYVPPFLRRGRTVTTDGHVRRQTVVASQAVASVLTLDRLARAATGSPSSACPW